MPSQVLQANTIQAQRDVNIYSTQNLCKDSIEILREHVAFGALHDSAERYDHPKCHPNTRTAVLDLIDRWARDKSGNCKPIFWLTGAAGAGKSAIAQSMVEKWKYEKPLNSLAFFFWRTSSERNQKTRLVPTLAIQLSSLIPSTKTSIEETVLAGCIFEQSLRSQMEELVVKPLESVSWSEDITIVIDGLDECCVDLPGQDHEAQQLEILEAMHFACQKAPSLRFLIASRPERQIRQSLSGNVFRDSVLRVSLQDVPDTQADIRLFLDCSFEEIRQANPSIPPSWPSKQQLELLVTKSSLEFIYPSVVIRYVKAPRQDPMQRLLRVLELQPSADPDQENNPFAELDALYSLVLKSVAQHSWPVVQDIFGFLCYEEPILHAEIFARKTFSRISNQHPYALAPLLLLSPSKIYSHLTDLYSVLDVPQPDEVYEPIKLIHATLSEYLIDQSRSEGFFIDEKAHLLRQSLLLIQHVEQIQQGIAPSLEQPVEGGFLGGYSEWYADKALYMCVCKAPRSKQLIKGLWKLIKDDIKPYPKFLNMNTNDWNEESLPTVWPLKSLKFLTPKTVLHVLNFLKTHNIKSVQPSLWRRSIAWASLTVTISELKKEHPDISVRGPKELGSSTG